MRPLDLVSQMVLDNGARWGEQATPEQWEDMRALLEPGGGPRRHFWLRSRGRSKTFDAAVATLAVMLAGGVGPGDEMYAAAASKDQAGLLANKILAISRNTPELAGAAEIQQFRVITARTGAVLNVLSSELAGSWGKTPRWLFGDEICNHDNTSDKEAFLDALVTAMVKRPDSVCLLGSTPSSQNHWAYKRWEHAVASDLWRASIVAGPAPWQDPAELEDERAYLPDYMWQRLFECRWAGADDALADSAALDDCTRTGMLDPEPSVAYVIGFDLGLKQDHSAVAVAHAGQRDGSKTIIVDRLYGWIPPAGGRIDLSDVLDTVAALSRQYNGAACAGDPWQAAQRIQDMREAGYQIREPSLTAGAGSKRAQMLMRLVRDRALSVPDDADLRKEFLSLRLAEGSTPGILRLVSDGTARGHFDRVTAVMYAAEELVRRPGSSWRDYCGQGRQCQAPACQRWYLARAPECHYCHTPNPDAPRPGERTAAASGAGEPFVPQPGGYLAAMLPPGACRCGEGHIYNGQLPQCPVCSHGRSGSPAMPAAFTRALGMGPGRFR